MAVLNCSSFHRSSNERMLGDQIRKGNNRKPDTASFDIDHPSALKQERLRKGDFTALLESSQH